MKLFWASLCLTIKRLLRRRGAVAMVVILAVLTAALCSFWALEQPVVAIRVGIAYDPGNAFCAELVEALWQKETPIAFEAYLLDARDELVAEVQTGRMECAYLLDKSLSAASLVRGERNLVTLLKSPASVLDLYVGEVLFAALYAASAQEMDVAVIRETLGLDEREARERVAERFEHYEENGGPLLQPLYQFESARTEGAPESTAPRRLLHGVIALFLLVAAAFSLPTLIEEKDALLLRLARGGARRYLLGVVAGLFCNGLLLGAVALVVARVVYAPALGGVGRELLALVAYQLALSAVVVLLSLLLRRADLVYGGTVFVALLTVLFGGVLLDIGEISRALGSLGRFFLSSYYIGALVGSGSMGLLAMLFGVGAVCMGGILLAAYAIKPKSQLN